MRRRLLGIMLAAASGTAFAQNLACNPDAPRADSGVGFNGAAEQVLARGGNSGPAWEWALGDVEGNLDWTSGVSVQWTVTYSSSGAATLQVQRPGIPPLTITKSSGMSPGNALQLTVSTKAGVGAQSSVVASISGINGQAVSGTISQTGDTRDASQSLFFYHPSMSQGFSASGTMTLTYGSLPTGSRLSFQVRAGNVPCDNQAPTVALSAPGALSVHHAGMPIALTASAEDPDGTVALVEFLANGAVIGTATSAPYSFEWIGAAPGVHAISARATDDAGAKTTSAAVDVIVNALPTAFLTSPAQGGVFTAPADIPLAAQVADPDGSIAAVEFYQGATLITTLSAPPYSFTWTGVPPGAYALTAKAIDNHGGSVTSAAINVTVNSGVAKLHFIHVDHLNTPRLVADDQQRTVWRWDQQEPFGNNVADENPSGLGAFDLPLRLPGQYYDRETALHYNARRDYDVTIGRYIESDPIGIWGGLNTYAYVGNRPLTYIDPTGLRNIYGNWCGPGGSGPVLDPVDQCCYDHDSCYGACGATWRDKVFGTRDRTRRSEMGSCDSSMCACLDDIDPKNDDERRGKARVQWFFKCIESPKVNSGGKKVGTT